MKGMRQSWYDMTRRCDHIHRDDYQNYGGRGINYDPSWSSFDNFTRDMGDSWKENLTLERIDVNLNYCKENCLWIEKSDQARNKRGYSNNQLSIPNMKLIFNKGVETLQVRIQNPLNGKRTNRWFSLNLYSFEKAVKLAENWLKLKRKEFGYADTHGS